MSAVLKDAPRLLAMSQDDLDDVLAIENVIYTHPWTRGHFGDSLRAGYDCWTWRLECGLGRGRNWNRWDRNGRNRDRWNRSRRNGHWSRTAGERERDRHVLLALPDHVL